MKRQSNLGYARRAAQAILHAEDLLATTVTCDTVQAVQAIRTVQEAVKPQKRKISTKTRFRLSSRIFK